LEKIKYSLSYARLKLDQIIILTIRQLYLAFNGINISPRILEEILSTGISDPVQPQPFIDHIESKKNISLRSMAGLEPA
jgi:hypothetical protein